MGINLLADEPHGINLLADTPEGVNLLADEPTIKNKPRKKISFYDLSPEDQAKAMNLARQQISAQNPNMPAWLRDMMLQITPKNESPRLQQIANEAEVATNPIGVMAGGAFKGFQTPFQGVASFIPNELAQEYANADPSAYFPQPQNDYEELEKGISELGGSLNPLSKLFGALKAGTQAARLPKILRNATALAGTGAIATPGDSGDKALGALEGLGLGAGGKLASAVGSAIGTKVPAFLRGLTNESTPEKLIEAIQKPHDVLDRTATKLYDYVRGSVKKRNLSIPVKSEYLNQAEKVLPDTRASKKLIRNAESGDYDAVHDLQSQLYKKGTAGIASDDIAIQNQGDEILDLRNKINEDVKNNLIQTGHTDIAHVLEQGKDVYKKLMDTYYNKNLPKGIQKMVQSDLRLEPENPENLFTETSKPMTRFLKQHPEAAHHVQGIQEKKAAINALGKLLGNTAKLGGISYAGKSLFDLLK